MTEEKGSWGGSRPGAGNPEFKPKWKSGKTTVIRVPEVIASEVLAVARQIDEGKAVTLSSNETTVQLEQENAQLRQKLQECQGRLEETAVTQSSEVLKEEVRRLQAVVSLEKQQKEMCQHKLDKAQQSNKELMNLAREARAELERLQLSTNSPDPAAILNRLRKERKKSKADLKDVELIIELVQAIAL